MGSAVNSPFLNSCLSNFYQYSIITDSQNPIFHSSNIPLFHKRDELRVTKTPLTSTSCRNSETFNYQVTELAEKARAGNRASLEQLVDYFHEDIFRMVYYRTRSRMDAEDLTQEIFMKMSKNLAGLKDAGRIRPWLYRIALNRVRDFHRKKSILSFGRKSK